MSRVLADTSKMTVEEWRALRKHSIGGSDAAVVVGLNSWKSKYTLYADKKGLIEDIADNEAMRIGRDLEHYVAERFTEATGKKVRVDNKMYMHDKYDFITANVDRKIVGENAGLECKTTNMFAKSDFENGEIPLYYYCQCMHYMAVMGYERMYLAVLVMGKAFYHFMIERNEDEIENLINAEVDFWENYIEENIAPETDGSESTTKTLSAIFPKENGGDEIYIGDTDFEVLTKLKKQKKEIEEMEKKYQNHIIEAMASAETDKAVGEHYEATYKEQNRTTVDSKKLKAEYENIYNECAKTSINRVFRIKELKK